MIYVQSSKYRLTFVTPSEGVNVRNEIVRVARIDHVVSIEHDHVFAAVRFGKQPLFKPQQT